MKICIKFVLLLLFWFHCSANVRKNGGNCIGLKSCRPKCITFQIHREIKDCLQKGAFAKKNSMWDCDRFQAENCLQKATCRNFQCNKVFPDHLQIRIGEAAFGDERTYSIIELKKGENYFTYCSLISCPKHVCALPEQLVRFL